MILCIGGYSMYVQTYKLYKWENLPGLCQVQEKEKSRSLARFVCKYLSFYVFHRNFSTPEQILTNVVPLESLTITNGIALHGLTTLYRFVYSVRFIKKISRKIQTKKVITTAFYVASWKSDWIFRYALIFKELFRQCK